MSAGSRTAYESVAKRGARWAFFEVLVSGLVQVIRVAILARWFISQEDFGDVALANSAILMITAFASLGTVPYIIFRTDADKQLFSSLYWMTVAAGIVSCAGTFLFADGIAAALGDPELSGPVAVLSLVLLFDSIGSPLMALYVRDFSFRQHAAAEATSTLLGTAVTFVAVAYGETVWALVLGVLLQRAARALIALACGYRCIGLEFRKLESSEFAKFSAYSIAERFVGSFNERVPYFFLGWLQGDAQVGIYAVISNLIAVPLQYAMNIALQAVTPVFARLQKETGRLSDAYFLSLELVMCLVAPAFFGLLAIAPLLTPMLLGQSWSTAVPTLQFMCITFTIHAVYYFSSGLTMGTGRARSAFTLTALQAPGMLVVAYLGAKTWGAEGVALGQAIISAMTMIPYYLFVTRPILGPCLPRFVASLLVPIGAAAVMAVMVGLAGTQLAYWRPELALPVQIVLGVGIYSSLILLLRPRIAREISNVLLPQAILERLGTTLLRLWPAWSRTP